LSRDTGGSTWVVTVAGESVKDCADTVESEECRRENRTSNSLPTHPRYSQHRQGSEGRGVSHERPKEVEQSVATYDGESLVPTKGHSRRVDDRQK
jgi:hypothetical protein